MDKLKELWNFLSRLLQVSKTNKVNKMEIIESILKAENEKIKICPEATKQSLKFEERMKIYAALLHDVRRETCLTLLDKEHQTFSELFEFLKKEKKFYKLREETLWFHLHSVLLPAGLISWKHTSKYFLTKLGKEIAGEIKAGKSIRDILLLCPR